MLKIKRGQKGFTLIELLIVIAILGILVAVAVPSIMGMVKTGKVGAANSELASVKTAAVAYIADTPDTGEFTISPESGIASEYVGGTLKGTYTFDSNGSLIETGDNAPDYGDADVTYDPDTHQFIKATS